MALNPFDIASVSRLLDDALALEPAEREPWLAALPAEHQRHAQALRDMLAQEARLDTDRRLAAMPKLAADDAVAHASDRIGPYCLLHEIGRGGMGSVWLAERADGAYKRQVALKLPRLAWGAGLAERMTREREIGMLLEHPNIARLYDAGVDERGRPFLALEFVDGQPIDTWCGAQGLSVRGRLRLFLQVIKAVAYAHGRLVVHRDLKPSNVLVTPDGQAHLLDFGIAKLLLEAAPGESGLTQEQGRVLTPHYASPEQVAGEAITVQSDVYSLGVLLYELLTGALPIAPKRSTLGAVEDAILHGDAPPASSRVKDKATARALRGEVDAMLAKAMQRDPGRRYATADAMALDIERHLNGETVTAQPDSLAYRMRKALRRHWVGVSAGLTVVLALVAGGGLALVQAQRAALAAQREHVVKEFVGDMLRASLSAPRQGVLPTEDVRRTVGDGVQLIQSRFVSQPEMQAELFGVVGSVYSSMGAYAYAAEYMQHRIDQLKAAQADAHVQAEAQRQLAEDLFRQGKTDRALFHAQQAQLLAVGNKGMVANALATKAKVELYGGKGAAGGKTLVLLESALGDISEESTAHAWLHACRGLWHATENRYSQTPALIQKGIDIALRVEGRLSRTAIDMRLVLATQVGRRGGIQEANQHLNAALGALEERGGPDAIRAAFERAFMRRWFASNQDESYAEAIDSIASSRRVLESAALPVPPLILASVDFIRGTTESNLGNVAQGELWLRRSQAAVLDGYESPLRRGLTFLALANQALRNGRHADADTLFLERRRAGILMGEGLHPLAAYDFSSRAGNFVMAGKFDEAEAVLTSAPALGVVDGVAEADAPRRSLRWAQARIHYERGRIEAASTIVAGLPDPAEDWDGIDSAGVLKAQLQCITRTHASLGTAWLENEATKRATAQYEHSPNVAWLRSLVGHCALNSGDRVKAGAQAALARAAFTAQPGVSPYFKAPLFKLELALGLKLPPV